VIQYTVSEFISTELFMSLNLYISQRKFMLY